MTAVASPPSFAEINRQGWINKAQSLNSIKNSDAREMNMFMSRKTLQRTNSSSSVSSTSSNGSTSTVISNASSQPINGTPASSAAGDTPAWPTSGIRKKALLKASPWTNGKAVDRDPPSDFQRLNLSRAPITNGVNGAHQPQSVSTPSQNQLMAAQIGGSQRPTEGNASGKRPALYLLSLNGSFERKTIEVPFFPETLRIGRQTNNKTLPTPQNGFFDSKVLSRQHAEIWADANGKIWIRDVKSSNGTFVNGSRLSPENRESEPHELQTQDHLELGIDIVSEDQKTVVHHKVAAKVEHAGFITPNNNVLDMNFSDLDPSNNPATPLSNAGFRGRTGTQTPLGAARAQPANNNGGPPNTTAQPRQYWLNPITTEHIVKKLHAEMRNAKLQNQDLARTTQFLSTLLSKEDIKNMEKPEQPEPPKIQLTNGNVSFRSDNGKTRFSEPPAPPPSQPLPEKPDAARPGPSDIASLKRTTTERPKVASTSPIRADNNVAFQQVMQLTEQLNNAKRALDDHSQKVRELEEKLNQEREARLQAEEMVQKMEVNHNNKVNGVAPFVDSNSELEKAFDLPAEQTTTSEPDEDVFEDAQLPPQPNKADILAAEFQARIESMAQEMNGLRQQLEAFRLRAEKAETERDADRKTLAEMVEQIRQRDQEEKRRAAERQSRSRSKGRRRSPSAATPSEKLGSEANGKAIEPRAQTDGAADEVESVPTLSQTTSVMPAAGALALQGQDPKLAHTLPYASMIGVVLIGMGLMAYLNGWQPKSRLTDF
ncbi:vacuolar protein sorting-associated protein 64 [Podospora fimiseda]|uniref:Vacuolar protein sorting-associated protein 64 n=1 Tax=Podospora fimiseda TaxID=252190 RepID=A0AAN7GZ13_9PEZI|nr:vacuolar protein sorting-associated protein 64 [Podospora fimiseda]